MEIRASGDECEQQATKRKTDKTSEVVRCGLEFYDQPCEDLARAMLGCVLVCRGEAGEECRGEVVEVEAYLGGEDRAAHSFGGRRTAANEAMFMPPGTAYVYSIYGVHHCFNVSSRGPGGAVLVRALCPVAGLEIMSTRRGGRRERDLCSGPGKLCQALAIDKRHNKVDMTTSPVIWLERGSPCPPEIVRKSPRIGIASAGPEWASTLLRFYQADSPYVSKNYAKHS
jgi:DNA-3-methyladenine glycosylase